MTSILDRDHLGAFCRHTHVEVKGRRVVLWRVLFSASRIYDIAGHKRALEARTGLRRTGDTVTRALRPAVTRGSGTRHSIVAGNSALAGCALTLVIGRCTVKTAPFPSPGLSAWMVPPWSCTRWLPRIRLRQGRLNRHANREIAIPETCE